MTKMRHRTLSIQLTKQCNASCEHCGTYSGPRAHARLTPPQIHNAICEASYGDFREVVFTGGEPTLLGLDLMKAIAFSTSLGLTARLVTNGWWAKNAAAAERWVIQLMDAGLAELNVSTGDQHARFVSVDKVVNAACAAVRGGLRTTILIELVETRAVTRAAFEQLDSIASLRRDFPPTLLSIYESPWMPLDSGVTEGYPNGLAVNRGNLARRGPCDNVLQTITISPDGVIGACCGIGMRSISELQLGHIDNTTLSTACRDGDSNALMQRLRFEGPERILASAAEIDPRIHWEDMYAHRCQACRRVFLDPAVRSVLQNRAPAQPCSDGKDCF